MKAILTQDEIEALNYKECKAALKLLEKTYDMNTTLHKLPKEQWLIVDEISNTLLWLEDRIAQFDDPRRPSMDPTAQTVVVKPVPVKKPQRKFSMNGVVYDSVRAAAKKAGIKETTLRNYVNRKPDIYFWVD